MVELSKPCYLLVNKSSGNIDYWESITLFVWLLIKSDILLTLSIPWYQQVAPLENINGYYNGL